MVKRLNESYRDEPKLTLHQLNQLVSSTTLVDLYDRVEDDFMFRDEYLSNIVKDYPELAPAIVQYIAPKTPRKIYVEIDDVLTIKKKGNWDERDHFDHGLR